MATYWENSCSFGLRYVSWYKYLTVNLFFSHLGFWSGNLFLIAPFPDLWLLVPLSEAMLLVTKNVMTVEVLHEMAVDNMLHSAAFEQIEVKETGR